MTILDDLLTARGGLLLGDGAMGTELFARGLTAGDPPEMWNIDMPAVITDVHRGYIDAGSDIILSNSFGGSRFRLRLHGLDHRVVELNAAAAAVARAAADRAERRVIVAGSMGPTGELIAPMGSMTIGDAEAAFAEQAQGLAEGGADVIWIETMSSLDEVEAAVAGARRGCDLPVTATMSFDTAGRTMMGVSGEEAGQRLVSLGLAAVGANCGNNIADTEAAVVQIRAGAGTTPVIAKANAGIPEWKGDQLSYTGTPEIMAAHLVRMREAGVSIVGGCCGTSTAHIGFLRRVLDGEVEPPDIPAPARVGAGAPAERSRASRRRRRG